MFEDSLLESGGKKLEAAPAWTVGDFIVVHHSVRTCRRTRVDSSDLYGSTSQAAVDGLPGRAATTTTAATPARRCAGGQGGQAGDGNQQRATQSSYCDSQEDSNDYRRGTANWRGRRGWRGWRRSWRFDWWRPGRDCSALLPQLFPRPRPRNASRFPKASPRAFSSAKFSPLIPRWPSRHEFPVRLYSRP